MAFIVLILIALTSLLRIESQASQERLSIMGARLNAHMGAMIALGELQRTMGPDTRVSAPTLETAAPPNIQWISRAIDAEMYRRDENGDLEYNTNYSQTLRYLISTDDSTEFDPTTYWPFDGEGQLEEDHALLLGPGSVSQGLDTNNDSIPDGYVAAPLVDIEADGSDSYAWWVSDDGAKAQINIVDPFWADTGNRNQREQATTAQRMGTEAIFSSYDPNDEIQSEQLGRAYYINQLGLVDQLESTPGEARKHFNDITTQSLAVPSNTHRGGLQRDLTAVIVEAEENGGTVNQSGAQWEQLMDHQESRIERWRNETVALEALGGSKPSELEDQHWNAMQAITLREDQADPRFNELIFPPLTDMHVQFDQGGATWEQLITWPTIFQRSGSGLSDEIVAHRRDQETMELSPVIAKVVVAAHATLSYPEAGLHWIPTVTLWNPYSVPIRMDASEPWRVLVDFDLSRIEYWIRLKASHPGWQPPYNTRNSDAHIVEDELWTPRFKLHWDYKSLSDAQFVFQIRDGDGGTDLVIPPGEARMYTMHEHVDITPGSSGGNIDTSVTLREGLAEDGQYSVYIRENIHNQIFDHPSWGSINEFESAMFKWGEGAHRDGKGYNNWHAYSFGNAESLNHPFPLDPNLLTDPDATDRLLKIPADLSIAVNRNGLYGWTIDSIALEANRIAEGGNTFLEDLRLILDTGDKQEPLAVVYHPNLEMPGFLNKAKVYHKNHPNIAKRNELGGIYEEWTPEPIPSGNSDAFTPASNGLPAWLISYGLRLPENDYSVSSDSQNTKSGATAPTRWLADFNPTAPFQLRDPSSRMYSGSDNYKYWTYSKAGFQSPPNYVGGFAMAASRYSDLSWMTPNDLNQFIGSSEDTPFNYSVGEVPRAILYEIPEDSEDLASIASLMHAPLIPTKHALMPNPNDLSGSPINNSDRSLLPQAMAESSVNYGSMQPTHMIGNSRAHLLVDRGRAEQSFYESAAFADPGESIPYASDQNPTAFTTTGAPWLYENPPPSYFPGYDSSWIYNEVLWDDFFFSPESNSRLVWQNEKTAADRDFTESGENLLIAGAFNINSVSIPAWAALLSSMMEVEMSAGGSASGSSAFSRFLEPLEEAFDPDTDDYTSATAYGGYRSLTALDIWDDSGTPDDFSDDNGLAPEIVNQIKERGPFLSLSGFVNRALVEHDPDGSGVIDSQSHGLAGALQSAIDRTQLNDAMGDSSNDFSWIDPESDLDIDWIPKEDLNYGDTFTGLHLENAEGRRNSSAPGELTQADILARIGSTLRPRSDTFTIRAQGRTASIYVPSAQAWCEMTVQRMPQYVEDSANSAGDSLEDLNPTNLRFGRRFEIINFRWLAKDKI